ncbi:MAG: polysaccharide pyruvyl transferase family protein [Candidatus Peribacteraceae bacterium]|jgi:polysaccharide pyruvyl transferase WcaK-like protein
MKALLVGNYGVGNLGDELLKEYFLRRYPEVEWIVVSGNPHGEREVPRIPAGIRSFLALRWWRTVRAMRRCDAVVFGGGTLFTDVESVRACVIWGLHASAARILRKPLLLTFQGVGPFRTQKGRRWTQRVLRQARFVSVRDAHSFDRVKELVPAVRAMQSFDPVLLLFHEDQQTARSGKVFSMIPRHNTPAAYVEYAKLLLRRGKYEGVNILSLHPDHPGEKAVCRELQEAMPVAELWEVRTLEGLVRHLRESSYVLSARYHGALAALALGIPFETFVQEQRDKLSSLKETELQGALLELAERGERELKQALEGLVPSKKEAHIVEGQAHPA